MEAVGLGVRHFCEEILGYKLSPANSANGEFYASAIPIYKAKKEFHFYLFFKKDTLNSFAKILLGIKELGEDELSDLCKEVANLVVGYSKNLLNEKEPNAYKIGTPEYLGRVGKALIKLEESQIYKVKNRTFKIGYKRA